MYNGKVWRQLGNLHHLATCQEKIDIYANTVIEFII